MSSGRKSFLLHFDSLGILDHLTNEQCGKLLLACRDFNLGKELELDATLELVFFPFKAQFLRDQGKYEKLCEKNRLIAENRYKAKSTTGTSGNQALPQPTKSTDNDSDSDSDSDSDNDSKDIVGLKKTDPIPYQQIVDSYNDLIGDDFPKCQALSTKRKTCLKKFWALVNKDLEKVNNYFGYFSHNADPHHRGQNDRGWRADIEFICREETVMKMREKIV